MNEQEQGKLKYLTGDSTVPYLSVARKISRFISSPKRWGKTSHIIRRALDKPGWQGLSIKDARKQTRSEWEADFLSSSEGWTFYQYQFTKEQLRPIIEKQGFTIIEEFIDFADEGIFHNFGWIAGRYDSFAGKVVFSPIGKILRRFCPVDSSGHMLCYITRKG